MINLDNIDIKVSTFTEKKITFKNEEQYREVIGKLQNIINKNPNAIVKTKVGNMQTVTTRIKSTKNKKKVFMFPEPNPVCIYYNSAIKHLENSNLIKKDLFEVKNGFNSNDNFVEFSKYYSEISQGIILLVTTLEGFLNQLLPDDIEFLYLEKKHNKSHIEMLDISTKIRKVVKHLHNIDFYVTNPTEYDNISLLVNLRNDLVHLKTNIKSNLTVYQDLYKRLIDIDLINISESVFIFINKIVPNYFIEKSL